MTEQGGLRLRGSLPRLSLPAQHALGSWFATGIGRLHACCTVALVADGRLLRQWGLAGGGADSVHSSTSTAWVGRRQRRQAAVALHACQAGLACRAGWPLGTSRQHPPRARRQQSASQPQHHHTRRLGLLVSCCWGCLSAAARGHRHTRCHCLQAGPGSVTCSTGGRLQWEAAGCAGPPPGWREGMMDVSEYYVSSSGGRAGADRVPGRGPAYQ